MDTRLNWARVVYHVILLALALVDSVAALVSGYVGYEFWIEVSGRAGVGSGAIGILAAILWTPILLVWCVVRWLCRKAVSTLDRP